MSRRHAIKTIAAATAAVVTTTTPALAQPAVPGPFTLPPLPFAYDALEPYVDAPTVQIHHDKHHATYVANLNKAIANNPELGKKTVENLIRDLAAVPEGIRAAVRNHGGGHANHALYWQVVAKNGGSGPKGELAKAIDKKFGSFTGFQEKFTQAATAQFGSGWAWLTVGTNKELGIESTLNQDSPLSAGRTPLLTIDVWEHAYYLKYQNRRPEYIAAFYHIINWGALSERYAKLSA